MNAQLKRLMLAKPLIILLGLITAYLLFAYFAINPLAKRLLPWVAEHQLASMMSVERVQFDPLRLIVRVDNLRLFTLEGSPLAGFDHLYVNAETSGIFKRAWRLKEIRLTNPQVAFDVDPKGKLNWEALIAKLNETPSEDGPMPRVLIDHIVIEGGNIAYTERNRPSEFKLALQPLGLALDHLSTLPEDRGEYLISAKLPEQGGTMKWKGSLGLNPIASNGSVDLSGLNVAKLLQVVDQKSVPLKLSAGDLQTGFDYTFAMTKDAEPKPVVQLNKLNIKLTQLAADLNQHAKISLGEASVTLPKLDFSMAKGTQLKFAGLDFAANQLALIDGKEPLFKLEQADVKGVDFDLAANQLNIADIALSQGEVNAKRAKDGSINWLALIPESKEEAPAPAQKPAEPAKSAKPAPADTAKPLAFAIGNIQLNHWKTTFADESFKHPLNAAIQDIHLGLNVNNADGIVIHNVSLDLNQISLSSALSPQPLASIDKVSVQEGSINLNNSRVKLAAIVLSGLQTQVLREADQSLNWQTALAQEAAASAAPSANTTKPTAADPWKVSLDKLALENSSVHIEDKTYTKPLVLDVQNIGVELQSPSMDLSKAMPVIAKFALKQGGQFDASGKLALAPFKTEIQLKLDGLSLKPFTTFVNQYAFLELTDGLLNTHGKLVLSTGQALAGDFSGGFSVNNLAMSEENSKETFLAWKEVSSDSLKFGFAENQLHMDSLSIIEPAGKFIIHEDKSINVQRMMRQPPAAAPSVVSTSAKADGAPAFGMTIERVSLQNADLQFADLSLRPQFGTHMNSLSGVINGLSTNHTSTAQVELDGRVDEFGSARIRGAVQPFNATEFTDLKLAFHNLDMSRLTPYSGKFAGRKINAGRLSVDLEYKIKQRQLAGENKFVIHQLKLGENIDSPDATHLPLDLAIALLEDKEGLIDLDLPITGSLDDPQFSYGKVIWKAIVNVLGKIVTSPFRAIGKLFGSDADKLAAIGFEPGKAVITPEAQEKLKTLAAGLAKRPTLSLTVSPTADPIADLAALQETATRWDVLTEMGLKLKQGEQPGPIDINNPKAQTAIENLLKDRQGQARNLKAMDKLKRYFKKQTPQDMGQYAEQLQQLMLTAHITEADVAELGKARATAVQQYLVEQLNLDAAHIVIGAPIKTSADSKGEIEIKMDLGVATK